MKKVMKAIILTTLLISSYVHAEIYTYTGANFAVAEGEYTTYMRITLTFSTSSAIPPNSDEFDISPILTSWSFSDGVNTIDNSNGETFPGETPVFYTDNNGSITAYYWLAISSPIGTEVGDVSDFIRILGDNFPDDGGDLVYADAVCTDVADGVCNAWMPGDSFAAAPKEGIWVIGKPSTSIPALSQWSLMLLALILGIVGTVRVKRKA